MSEANASTPVEGSVCMMIRHGEKPDDSGRGGAEEAEGIDEQGTADPHSLTQRGWERARALGKFFAAPRAGIARPARIYAPGAVGGHAAGRRPRETAGPIAAALGLGVDLAYPEGEEKKLAKELSVLGPRSPALVVWEHTAIVKIIGCLAGSARPKFTHWPGDRYDVVIVCRAAKDGWRLTQAPQLVLPGDSPAGL